MDWQIKDILNCFRSDSVLWWSEDDLQITEVCLASREGSNKIFVLRYCEYMSYRRQKHFAALIQLDYTTVFLNHIVFKPRCPPLSIMPLQGRSEGSTVDLTDKSTGVSGPMHKPLSKEMISAGHPYWITGLCNI